jgi:hypothetical protein
MGSIRNFDKIKFRPFSLRIGNLKVTNFYTEDGMIKPFSNSDNDNEFSHYSISKIELNPYFGKESEYILNGEFYKKDNDSIIRIHKSCFKNSESSYVLAYWIDINHDERRPDLKFVGSRPFELTKEEMVDFMDLAKCGQQEIENILRDFDEDNF